MVDVFERLATFVVTHELCAGEIETIRSKKPVTTGLSMRCPGCGAILREVIRPVEIRAHVLGVARLGGFTGTFKELHVADYERYVLSSPVVEQFTALLIRLRGSARLH